MQIPFGLDSQISEKGAIYRVTEIPWAMVPRPCRAEGVSDPIRAPQARPCSHADLDSSQVFRRASGGVSQGKERHPDCAGTSWEEKEFHRATFLGPGVFCFHGGDG